MNRRQMPAGTKDLMAYAALLRCDAVSTMIAEAMHGGEHELEMLRAMLAELKRIKKGMQ